MKEKRGKIGERRIENGEWRRVKIPVNMSRWRRIVYVVAGPLLAASPLVLELPRAGLWIMPATGLILLAQGLSGY